MHDEVVALLRHADVERALRMHRRFVVREIFLKWREPQAFLLVALLGLSVLLWWSSTDRIIRASALALTVVGLFLVACQVLITIIYLASALLSRRDLAGLHGRIRRSPSGTYALPFRTDQVGLVVGSGSGAKRHQWDEFETVLVTDELLLLVGKGPLLIPIPCVELEPTIRDLVIGKLPSPE